MKHALITGASGGIGAAVARKLAASGYMLTLHYHQREEAAKKLADELHITGGNVMLIKADLSKQEEIERMFKEGTQRSEILDVLVNNAAITHSPEAEAGNWEELSTLFALNSVGVIYGCMHAVESMRAGGAIVNVTSEAARFGGNGISAYAASKGAVESFTRGFARQMAPRNIRVNAVSPGLIDTGIHAQLPPLTSLPMQRLGTAEEVASTIAWLVSSEASYISGAVLPVSGAR